MLVIVKSNEAEDLWLIMGPARRDREWDNRLGCPMGPMPMILNESIGWIANSDQSAD